MVGGKAQEEGNRREGDEELKKYLNYMFCNTNAS